MSPLIAEAVVATVMILALLAGASIAAERYERRRRARWWHDHVRGGGLVRTLIARWSGPRRLTWRPDDRDDDTAG